MYTEELKALQEDKDLPLVLHSSGELDQARDRFCLSQQKLDEVSNRIPPTPVWETCFEVRTSNFRIPSTVLGDLFEAPDCELPNPLVRVSCISSSSRKGG